MGNIKASHSLIILPDMVSADCLIFHINGSGGFIKLVIGYEWPLMMSAALNKSDSNLTLQEIAEDRISLVCVLHVDLWQRFSTGGRPTRNLRGTPAVAKGYAGKSSIKIFLVNTFNTSIFLLLAMLLFFFSLPSAVPTMRLSQDSSRLSFCLFFGRFTSPGSFWIFFPFRSSLT